MSKYNKGDKVVLRNDLVGGKKYGRFEWGSKKNEDLSKLDYVEILNVFSESAYEVTTGWCITDEMISHKYGEEYIVTDDSIKYQKGDKVVLRKDLVVGKQYNNVFWGEIKKQKLSELPYITIVYAHADGTYNTDNDWIISGEMISHVYDKLASTSPSEIPDHLIEQIEYTPTYPSLINELESAARGHLINKALDSGDKELFMQLTSDI